MGYVGQMRQHVDPPDDLVRAVEAIVAEAGLPSSLVVVHCITLVCLVHVAMQSVFVSQFVYFAYVVCLLC